VDETTREAGITSEQELSNDLRLPTGMAGVVCSLLLALWAQSRMPASELGGLVAFAVAALVFVGSIVLTSDAFNRDRFQVQDGAASSRRQWQHLGFFLCLPLITLTLVLFNGDESPNLVIALWLLGIGISVSLAWSADRSDRLAATATAMQVKTGWSLLDWLSLSAVVAVAAMLRLWEINDLPGVYEDEGAHLIDSYRVIDGVIKTPFESVTWSEGAFYNYLLAGLLQTGVEASLALKLMGVVPGIITVGATYLLLRRLFEAPLPFFGAAFLAISSWHIITSRWGYVHSFDMMLVTLMLLLLVRGLQSRARLDFALAGLAMGLALSLSKSSVPVVLIAGGLAVFLILHLGWQPAFRRYGERFLILALVAFMVFAPRGLYIAEDPDEALRRPQEVLLFDDKEWPELKKEPLRQAAQNAIDLASSLNIEAGHAPRWNVHVHEPTLDLVSGALLILGFAYALTRVTRWPFALLLLWAAVVLVPASTALALDDRPVTYRIASLMPAVYALAALPIVLVWRMQTSETGRRLVVGGGLALLALSAYLNVEAYFGDYRGSNAAFLASGQVDTRVARQVEKLDSQYTVFLTSSQVYHPVVDVLNRGRATYLPLNAREDVPSTTVEAKPLAFVLVKGGKWADGKLADNLLGDLQRIHPQGRLQDGERDKEGSVLYYIYTVER